MVHCAAVRCTNNQTTASKDISFHRFPKDPTQSDLWVRNMRRKNFVPTKTSYLCSEHFLPICYYHPYPERKRRDLKKNAVPTLFTFSDDNDKSPANRTARSGRISKKKRLKQEDTSLIDENDATIPPIQTTRSGRISRRPIKQEDMSLIDDPMSVEIPFVEDPPSYEVPFIQKPPLDEVRRVQYIPMNPDHGAYVLKEPSQIVREREILVAKIEKQQKLIRTLQKSNHVKKKKIQILKATVKALTKNTGHSNADSDREF